MAARHIVLSLALLTLAPLAAARAANPQTGCYEHIEQTLTGAGDLKVEVVEQVCDADIERVYVTNRSSGRVLIFSYYRTGVSPMMRRADLPPTITWLDADHLRIDIDVIDQVVSQRSRVGRVHVEYRIGRTIYR